MKEQIRNITADQVRGWKPAESESIHRFLEEPNWAPWLAASAQTLAGRARVFPQGQLLLKDDGLGYLASLSMNQIEWDGHPETLPSWDQIAGLNTTDYSETYNPDGNTLVLMSMNVSPNAQGCRLPSKMVLNAQRLAEGLGIEHLIGSFRPSGYGQYKKELGNHSVDFWSYCIDLKVQRTDHAGFFGEPGAGVNLPYDPWLRSLCWMGMKPIKEDAEAMVVMATLDEFEQYQLYQPTMWSQVTESEWECGEVGRWFVDAAVGTAIYKESNLWGRLPLLWEIQLGA